MINSFTKGALFGFITLSQLCVFSSVASTHAENETKSGSHFPALESPDLVTAMCHLKTYNQKLNTLVNNDKLTALDMLKVHELTYTIENAIARIQTELTIIAADLETVHKASERLDANEINTVGKKYMKQILEVTKPSACL